MDGISINIDISSLREFISRGESLRPAVGFKGIGQLRVSAK
jgi:hypothetical protein